MAKRKVPTDSLASKPRAPNVLAAGGSSPKGGDGEEWRAMLLLTNTEKDALDDFAERVRKATRSRPTLSELVRALLDAQLAALKSLDVGELKAYMADAPSARIETWVREQIARRQ